MTTRRHSSQRGLTLIEIMVVLAIFGLILAVAVPSITGAMQLQQLNAARELAGTYRFLLAEAGMRNVTFRLTFNLDTNAYKVEVGDPSAVLFGSPEELAAFEKEREDRLKQFSRMSDEEKVAAQAEEDPTKSFKGLDIPMFTSEVQLPENTAIAWVYTPSYPEPVHVPENRRDDDPPTTASSYVFSNGSAEYTVIRLVDLEDPDGGGFTVIVEPLSGMVRVDDAIVNPEDVLRWLPSDAPSLQ